MKSKLYPIRFQPILKNKIWGGNKLSSVLNKETNLNTLGESWEISDVGGDASIVLNGVFKGQSIKELITGLTSDLLGVKNHQNFGDKFPLLIKFIDAKLDLSIQLHPNDALAVKRHKSFGKTEMWYVMDADDDANIIVDFNQEVDSKKYLKHLNNKSLREILNFDKVKPGDAYFIEAGRIHAIGAGVMLAEIQQTSDITYRIYDWDRLDANGKERELHNDLAIDAIDFNMNNNFRLNYSKTKNVTNKLISCPYFTTNYLSIESETLRKVNTFDSFIIYMCVEGEVTIITSDSNETLKKGETVLIPAAIKCFDLVSKAANLLEVYV